MKNLVGAIAVLAGITVARPVHATYAPGCTVALGITGAVLHEARSVAIQADGKILVAGYADLGSGGGRDFLVARLHPDLSFDTSFNGTGYRVDDLSGRDDEAFAVAVQFDQKILVGGYAQKGASKHWFAIVRYNRDGTLDTSFGTGGASAIDFTGSQTDELRAITIQPDGKILGAGFLSPLSVQRLAVIRLTKNGALDTTFDGDGSAQPTIGASAFSFATGVGVQPDGRIVVSGEARFVTSDFVAVRLTSTGALDPTFKTTGWAATDIGTGTTDSASAIFVQSDGKLVLAGSSNGNAAIVRYLPGGGLDGAFGSGGKVVYDFGGTDRGNGLTLDPAGNVLVGGATNVPPSNFAFARFRPNGVLDLPKTDDVSGLDDVISDIAVTRQAKILVVGSSQGSTNWKATVALYNPDGTQDCGPAVYPVDVFTAGSSGDAVAGQVMLNWVNPSYGPFDRTVIRRDTVGCPLAITDGVQAASVAGAPGAPGGIVDTVPLGATYYYTAFAVDALSNVSTGVCKTATPFDRTMGKTEWLFDTSISALTTPGLRLNVPLNESVVYSVANDGLVHAVRGGAAATGGGSWPAGWKPFRMRSAAQGRPPIVPLPPASTLAVLLGSQDGRVYAVDALNGDLIWRSAKLGMTVQAAPAVVLAATPYNGGKDYVFVGTRESGPPSRFYALNANDGTVAWVFDNGGGPTGVGMIVGNASVDYGSKRVYFTSAQGASGKTTWCLDYTATPPAKCSGWSSYGVTPLGGGDIEASPILFQGSVFVSDTSLGALYQVNPLDGSDAIFFNLGDTGAKGFVFPQFFTSNLFASTSSSTKSVRFGGMNWTGTCVNTPTTPIAVPGTDWVFVGSNEGRLFQFSAASGTGCPTPLSACVGDCASTIVGAPTYDVLKSMLYVGTDDGVIFALRPPF